MQKYTAKNIRNTFTNYFVRNGHTRVPASPLIPYNDPTMMFVNSGMVQFKNMFTGKEQRNYTRATSSQKSVRAGGKHNDLENVGYTARHHTFFEMLGNFSFGDYFKEEAIFYAWNLLTKEFDLPADKLFVTVYHTDDEAFNIWKKITNFSDDKIIRISTHDNFWSMGELGPCGPCSEIFYDHGSHIKGGLPGTADEDGDRYIEIWNMVFMQFEQIDKNTRIDLPQKSIDTGMGLERITAIMQGVHDNYDIDIFKDIIDNAEDLFKVKAENEARFSYRVIADHLRCASFLIADGMMPSNDGRGYVLRRIVRRALRHVHQLDERRQEPVMYKLVPKLVDLMGEAYPELVTAQSFITDVLKNEEERFKLTLAKGIKLLNDETNKLKEGDSLTGEVAFKLYDTYGFPLDLTQDILKRSKISIDTEGFNQNMQQQKERARKSWVGSGENKADPMWFDILSEYGPNEFLGYIHNSVEATALSLIVKSKQCDYVDATGQEFILISSQTPFYGESGGQLGDIGVIETANAKIKVVNTLKYLGSLHIHICQLISGKITKNDQIKLTIDQDYRKQLRIHHSATHILHAVLKEILGNHVTQKGSLVAHDRLRFDISHHHAVSANDLNLIETRVNQIILENSEVKTNIMKMDQAIKEGATALFGEKYEDEVRVISIGDENLYNKMVLSKELCGGTHVARTGDIGLFKIVNEGAIAAGVRRIEAVCGFGVINYLRGKELIVNQIAETLKTPETELNNKIISLINNKKDLEKHLLNLKISTLDLSSSEIASASEKLGDIQLIYKVVEQYDLAALKSAAEKVAGKLENLVVIYVSKFDAKLSIAIAVSKIISNNIPANALAKTISAYLSGGGGGQNTLAQAGGSSDKLLELKSMIVSSLNEILP